jgi:hypothetical protein
MHILNSSDIWGLVSQKLAIGKAVRGQFPRKVEPFEL